MRQTRRSTGLFGATTLLLAACASPPVPHGATFDRIGDELRAAAASSSKPASADKVAEAMLPSLQLEPPPLAEPVEPRFDLSVSNAPVGQVLMAVVSGTRYSMLVPPDVTGNVTLSLKNVTAREALESIRDLYGYGFRVTGTRILAQSNTLQSQVFQVNYLLGRRKGESDVRVTSSSITGSSAVSGTMSGAAAGTSTPAAGASGYNHGATDSTRVQMSSDVDFWSELKTALTTIIGSEGGRNVVVSPMSGVVVVRGMPADLRNVDRFLRATQLIVERQVMLEAKIIEIELNQEFQAGVNWASFGTNGNTRYMAGVVEKGTRLPTTGHSLTSGTVIRDPATGAIVPFPDSNLTTVTGTGTITSSRTDLITPGKLGSVVAGTLGNGLFGLAFQTANFSALLNFLETQGGVQVLSSPRIATLNNQKAVLKVGFDEFYVTNVTTTVNTTTTGNTTSPSISLQPFFSGISLDVTPQIDEANNITLHVHPAISVVHEKAKNIDLGTLGQFTLPLATSTINETDSIVRVQNGYIVAIGGLMKQEESSDRNQIPGLGSLPGVGALFGQRGNTSRKRELVILIKPTIIETQASWNQELGALQERLPGLDQRRLNPPPAQ